MSIQQIDLPVTGMTCASCVRNVERVLKKTEGVAEASVNIATVGLKAEKDATRKLTMSSKDGA
jgi:Cu+-exporting ATPase